MTKNKAFQITLSSGEVIMRNSEGICASKCPGINYEMAVSQDYVIDCLVQNIQEYKQQKERTLQRHYDMFLSLYREAKQNYSNDWELKHDSPANYAEHAKTVHTLALGMGFELKKEAEGE
ncbi:hypothetical protein FO510_05855 [Bacillus pumilus]|uniref:hypothetical protein n=1 Tax=Bacillus pumilus TaxID=1408 RepID=UPI00017A5E5F|nr:hypothetical protein [Bacillus pumilus]EDW22384.1 hypothetical protein BAT_0064 [Bacillus pumilus ATCC 7061]MBB6600739.1 hypothetical protein [Bacillus pumilus]MCR4352106.1 hypothetical protein [Bacillus pumilus]MCY7506358.1 hypothetical protein [Bacillus pumilus]MDH3174861.1 hypothetical protein [Bacillus pumilus]